MYQVTNLQHKTEKITALHTDVKKQMLQGNESLITTTTEHSYTDGTIMLEVKKERASAGKTINSGLSKTIIINGSDKWPLVLMVFVLATISVLSYGTLAAFL